MARITSAKKTQGMSSPRRVVKKLSAKKAKSPTTEGSKTT